jgi:hypothetical protein
MAAVPINGKAGAMNDHQNDFHIDEEASPINAVIPNF